MYAAYDLSTAPLHVFLAMSAYYVSYEDKD